MSDEDTVDAAPMEIDEYEFIYLRTKNTIGPPFLTFRLANLD